METSWKDMRSAPMDGSIFVGRFWRMHDVTNGPFPGYVLMQWDEFENAGWMDPDGLTLIDEPVTEWCPLPK